MIKRKGRRLKAEEIPNLVRTLTVLDVDVSRLEERLSEGRKVGPGGDTSVCIIDIECCIINCKDGVPPDLQIAVNPGDRLRGFVFKMAGQANNPEAPIYCIPELDARTAFRMGHESLKVPRGRIEARLVGVAGEVFTSRTLTKQKISATASVINLLPGKGLKTKVG